MCASHVALILFTGSLEMSVFQTLSAGNIWQPGAPGTGGPFSAGRRGRRRVSAPVPKARGKVASARAEKARKPDPSETSPRAQWTRRVHLRNIGANR